MSLPLSRTAKEFFAQLRITDVTEDLQKLHNRISHLQPGRQARPPQSVLRTSPSSSTVQYVPQGTVDLHPHSIASQIMGAVEHFLRTNRLGNNRI